MSDTEEAIRKYFDALATGQVDTVPWAEDIEMMAPLGPDGLSNPIRGIENARTYISNVTPAISNVELTDVLVKGESGVGRAILTFNNPPGAVLRVADYFRMKDGKIQFQENHYDPRPVIS